MYRHYEDRIKLLDDISDKLSEFSTQDRIHYAEANIFSNLIRLVRYVIEDIKDNEDFGGPRK